MKSKIVFAAKVPDVKVKAADIVYPDLVQVTDKMLDPAVQRGVTVVGVTSLGNVKTSLSVSKRGIGDSTSIV